MRLDYRQSTVVAVVGIGAVVLTAGFTTGNTRPAVTFVAIQAIFLAALLWATRRTTDDAHVSHAEAHAAAGGTGVIVYWQPD